MLIPTIQAQDNIHSIYKSFHLDKTLVNLIFFKYDFECDLKRFMSESRVWYQIQIF